MWTFLCFVTDVWLANIQTLRGNQMWHLTGILGCCFYKISHEYVRYYLSHSHGRSYALNHAMVKWEIILNLGN